MKVFLDTNIFVEYFQKRDQYKYVNKIFKAIEDNKIQGVVSVGCVYTLAYLIRMQFKRINIYRPEQTQRLRETLNTILDLVTVGNINHKHLVTGVNDDLFDDVEDSFQYQCAIQNKCDALVTINLKDFNTSVCTKIDVYSPKDFVSIFL